MNPLLTLHVACMLAGLLLLVFGGLCGMLYLVQSRRVRRGKITAWDRRLPDLERLERYNRRTVRAGFVLLTVGVFLGALMISASAQLGWLDARILATLMVWLLCAILVTLSLLPRYRGRPVALLTLAAALLIVIIPVLAGVLWPTWHVFFRGGGGGG